MMTRTQTSVNHARTTALRCPVEQRLRALSPRNDAHAPSQNSVILSEAKDPISAYALIRRCPEFSPRTRMPVLQVTLAFLLLSALASAQTLTGSVKNATTGKPAAGDDVVLLGLGQGMEEAGRTKADAKGNFSFKLNGEGPHLIRVIHQGVTYHRIAPPGTTSVDAEVYDVGKKVEGIEVIADIMRFQAGGGQ